MLFKHALIVHAFYQLSPHTQINITGGDSAPLVSAGEELDEAESNNINKKHTRNPVLRTPTGKSSSLV
jgi:hypothetical protein